MNHTHIAPETPAFVQKLMKIMADVAEQIPMPVYRGEGKVAVIYKADGTPVTATDSLTEYALIERLTQLLPGSQVLGEETVGAGAAWKDSPLLHDLGNVWIVDPIDGTYYFARKEPFGMLIGLRQEGRMTLSVAYYPVEREFIWSAVEMAGTYHCTIQDGILSANTLVAIPEVAMRKIVLGFYLNHQGGGTIEEVLTEEALQQFRPGACVGRCIATAMRRMLLQGDHAYINGAGYTPWDFETTAYIARKAGAVVTHMDGTAARTAQDSCDVIFAPCVKVSSAIHAGLKA